VIELSIVAVLVYTGRYQDLIWVIFAGSVIAGGVQYTASRHFDQKVRHMPGVTPPVEARAVAVALTHRTLRQYTSAPVETALAGITILSAALCVWEFVSGGRAPGFFFVPLAALYLHAGILLMKDTLVRMRNKVPSEGAEAYTRFTLTVRSVWAEICDWMRGVCTAILLSFSVLGPLQERGGVTGRWIAMLPMIGILFAFLPRMKTLTETTAAAARNVRPADMSMLQARPGDPNRFALGGLLFFDADNPLMVIRGPLGPTFNLANPRTYAFIAWAGGVMAVIAWKLI
jgi:hypothetical protein